MHVERLQQLRRVVEAAPEDRLHMRTWSERAPCGTAYCAAGWAAIDPWFQGHTPILEIFAIKAAPAGASVVARDDSDPFVDLGELFELDHDDAEALFASGISPRAGPHSVSKDDVLTNIDRLLAGFAAEPYDAVLDEENDDQEDDE